MTDPKHAVAVIGGATAGAEIAQRLAHAGAEVTVFEMNPRPFGKIEDGLPRWHRALREKEFASIRERLSTPGVRVIPMTKIGRDVPFDALVNAWGFSAVVLACGAWRDRPLPVPDADRWVGKGLLYQNPYIISFNHAEDPHFRGPRLEVEDDVLVVGGGLASIDVAKLVMLENVRRALEARGHHVDVEELEKRGIPATLEEHGLTLEGLGIKGATLFYRRRPEDMPVMEAPADATPERLAKVEQSRRHIVGKAIEKFGFRFEPLAIPERLLVEGDRVVGLVLRRARVDGKKLVPTDEVFERRGRLVVSSIGSIPEALPGITMKGELFPFTDDALGRLDGFPTVFSAGNVVTGKGNIIASRKHASKVAGELVERFLGLAPRDGSEAALTDGLHAAAAEAAERVASAVAGLPPVTPEALAKTRALAAERQGAVGYTDLAPWLARFDAKA